MSTVFIKESLGDLIPILHHFQGTFKRYGMDFSDIVACHAFPSIILPSDFLIWEGNEKQLPALPEGVSMQIRSRKTGSFGLAHSLSSPVTLDRWEEVEIQGRHRFFAGSVAEDEKHLDDLSWAIDRLKENHSYTHGKKIDWESLHERTQKRLDQSESPQDVLRSWEWLFARIKDSHTKISGLNGSVSCRRVHCGVFGRFLDPGYCHIENVCKSSAAENAGLKPGMQVMSVDGVFPVSVLTSVGGI